MIGWESHARADTEDSRRNAVAFAQAGRLHLTDATKGRIGAFGVAGLGCGGVDVDGAEAVDAALLDEDLDPRLVNVVAPAVPVVDAQDRLEVREQMGPGQELPYDLAQNRGAPEPSADDHAEADHPGLVLQRVQPAMTAKREELVRETAAIAERHPGLRACLTDNVVFLAGGSRTVPLDELTGPLSVAQADALVARLT